MCPNFSHFFLFADETNIYFEPYDLTQLQKIMNRELKKVKKWLDANRLALNIDKTNFVVFRPLRIKIPEPVTMRFGRQKIKRESCVGILLDENLSWKFHINELSKKLSRTVGIFYKIRHFCPSNILRILYYSLFYSFLSYGISVWSFTFKSYFRKLLLVQKKIVKVMTFNKQTASSTLIFLILNS